MYQYKAEIIRVVDGDTLWLDVDLGFDVRRKDSFRLYGIDAPELSTDAGKTAKAWLEDAVSGGIDMLTTYKDTREKYGRYLGTLWKNGRNLNQAMVDAGHAVKYSGGSRTIKQ